MAMYSVLASDGDVYGPVDEAGLVQWVREGRLHAGTSIRCEPSGQVVQAGSLPFLASVLGAPVPAPMPAVQPAAPMSPPLIPLDSPAARMHQLSEFSVGLVVLLEIVTLGIFPLIWFGLMQDKMPRTRHDDPSAGKHIGFMFIPFFNLYWMFFANTRLCDRIAEQRELRGLPGESLRGLAVAACVTNLIPCVNCLAAPITWMIFAGMLQSRINELVQVTQQQIAQPQAAAIPQSPGKGF